MLNTKKLSVILISSAIALQGCSTSNGGKSEFEQLVAAGDADLGDFGDEYNAAQAQYVRGQEMHRSAERDLDRARDLQRQARRDIGEAEDQIEEAEELMERAQQRMEQVERQYRQTNATVELVED